MINLGYNRSALMHSCTYTRSSSAKITQPGIEKGKTSKRSTCKCCTGTRHLAWHCVNIPPDSQCNGDYKVCIEVAHLLSTRSTCRGRERGQHVKHPFNTRTTFSTFGLDHKNLNTMPWCIQSLFPRLTGSTRAQSFNIKILVAVKNYLNHCYLGTYI